MESGFAFHVHHDELYEWCWDYDERVEYIKQNKPENEISIRLELFRFIDEKLLPEELLEVGQKHDEVVRKHEEVGRKYDEVGRKYDEAGQKYYPFMVQLHKRICGCGWTEEDGIDFGEVN